MQLCHLNFLWTIHLRGVASFTWREAQKLAKTPIHSAFSWTVFFMKRSILILKSYNSDTNHVVNNRYIKMQN